MLSGSRQRGGAGRQSQPAQKCSLEDLGPVSDAPGVPWARRLEKLHCHGTCFLCRIGKRVAGCGGPWPSPQWLLGDNSSLLDARGPCQRHHLTRFGLDKASAALNGHHALWCGVRGRGNGVCVVTAGPVTAAMPRGRECRVETGDLALFCRLLRCWGHTMVLRQWGRVLGCCHNLLVAGNSLGSQGHETDGQRTRGFAGGTAGAAVRPSVEH